MREISVGFEDWVFEAWVTVIVCVGWLVLFGYLLMGLRSEESLPKPPRRPRRCEGCVSRLLAAATTLGAAIVSALDDALARVTNFVKDVVTQLTGAKEANDAQTAKLAELEVALSTALADDNADKAAIAALQAEVSSLQDEVAAKINAAVDALENAPTAEEVVVVEETPVSEELVVVDEPVDEVVPVSEDTIVVVDEAGEAPVES